MAIYRGTYYSASSCTGSARPGAKALMSWYLGAYGSRGAANLGIYVCKHLGSGFSIHGHGRACDMGTKPYNNPGKGWPTWGWALANALLNNSKELGIQLIIFRGKVWSCRYPDKGWRSYDGSDPHNGHMHVELIPETAASLTVDRIERVLGGSNASPTAPTTGAPAPPLREGDEGPSVGLLQRGLNEALGLNLVEDEDYGPATTAGVKALQRAAGIEEDGIYGDDSADALRALLEDDMDLSDKLNPTDYTEKRWGVKTLNVGKALTDTYTYARNASDYASAAVAEQAKQTALLKQLAAGQSGMTEEAITAAVAAGVRQAIPSAEELATAVAAAVDHDLDTAAVAAALREVLGSVDNEARE
jgi:peptidoglycan hydrolase-like protein with peptidoglycan-binding domain